MVKRPSSGRRLRTRWRAVRPFLGEPRHLVLLCVSAFFSGVSEAALLTAVVQVSVALAEGAASTGVHAGPLSVEAVPVPVLLSVAGALAAFRLALGVVQAQLGSRMAADVLSDIRIKMFAAFLRTAHPVQAEERDGHLQELLTTYASRIATATVNAASGVVALANFTVLLVAALVLDPASAGLILLSVIGLFFVLRPLSTRAKRLHGDLQRTNREYAGHVTERVSIALEVKVFDVGEQLGERMDAAVREVTGHYRRTKFLERMIPGLYQNVAIGLLVLAMAVIYAFSAAELAALGAVVLILVRALTYGQTVQSTYHRSIEVIPYLRTILAQQQRYERHAVRTAGQPLPGIERIEFDAVSFAYVPDHPVLQDLRFGLARGDAIGVVGPSGAGKSTLVQLLLRLREPQAGSYLVNGLDATAYALGEFYRRVSFVPQEPRLFDGTVAENIRFFRPEVDEQMVVAAARLAQLDADVRSLRDGYDTVVGPRGSNLSGGQRQRVALARALVHRPDVLVLDEPTSSLDMPSEVRIQDALQVLKPQVAMVIVAHRLTTLSICDRILVLSPGGGFALDTPDNLMASSDFYRDAFDLSQA